MQFLTARYFLPLHYMYLKSTRHKWREDLKAYRLKILRTLRSVFYVNFKSKIGA